MLISSVSSGKLAGKIVQDKEVYCKGLFLSARWFIVSQCAGEGTNLIILPDKESAEYCASDLYSLVDGDVVFFLPDSGKGVEKSNYKSTLGVQRTSAVGKIISNSDNKSKLFIVTYPEALVEFIPGMVEIKESVMKVCVGQEISHEAIKEKLAAQGFEREDFVSAPGQYSIRGSIIDIFSYSFNDPFRVSFFGDEIEKIHVFDCNTQLSKEERREIEVFPDLVGEETFKGQSIVSLLPEETVVWLDSYDIYKEREFIKELDAFRKVFLQVPLGKNGGNAVKFSIAPQPVFNKNFEILTSDIRKNMEYGYRVFIFSEKKSQIERLKSILTENNGLVPAFVEGKNIHSGFIDHDDRI